jgi:hypothetical protein
MAHLAKGTEKFILGRYFLLGISLILPSLRPWGVAARPGILENRGGAFKGFHPRFKLTHSIQKKAQFTHELVK